MADPIVMDGRVAEVAFRSTDAEVIGSFAAWQQSMEEHHRRIGELRRRIDPDDLFDVFTRRHRYVLCLRPKEGHPPPPDGWRYDAEGDVRPDCRRKLGKAERQILDDLNKMAPPDMHVKGMPYEVWSIANARDGSFMVYRCGLFVHEGAAYAHWKAFPEGYDPSLWEEIKLSEFYAAREAFDAAAPAKVVAA